MGLSKRIPALIFLAILALVTVVGFATGAWAADPAPLRVNYSAVSGAFAPLWLAEERGLFGKYGLAVDLRYVVPRTATQGLLSRTLDIVNPGGEIIEAGLGGEKVVFIAGILNRVVFSLFSKPEITRFSDLKGKVLGVTQPGSTTDFTARLLAQEAGMVPGKDLQILHLQGIPETFASLSQGVIDAGILSAPVTLKARQAGFRELVNITEKNIPMIHAAFATTREFASTNPERVRQFLQAYVEGLKIAKSDAEGTKRVIGKYTKMGSADDLEETYRTFLPAWEKVPAVRAASVQTLLNFATHPAARTAKPDQFIDNSFVSELERSGFIERLYRQ